MPGSLDKLSPEGQILIRIWRGLEQQLHLEGFWIRICTTTSETAKLRKLITKRGTLVNRAFISP
jgi:hypothetical protein